MASIPISEIIPLVTANVLSTLMLCVIIDFAINMTAAVFIDVRWMAVVVLDWYQITVIFY